MSKNKKNHLRKLQKKFARWKKLLPAGTVLCYTMNLYKRTMATEDHHLGKTHYWSTNDLTCQFFEWTDYGLELRDPPNETEALLVVENLGRGSVPYDHIWYLKVLRGEKLGKVAIPFVGYGSSNYLRTPENFFDVYRPADLVPAEDEEGAQ